MIEIKPAQNINAVVACPGSKSYTNRALLIAALAQGVSRLDHPLFSDDTHYMSDALNQFGVTVEKQPTAFHVEGNGGRLRPPQSTIYVGNAGTAMRFLTTFAALAPGYPVWMVANACESARFEICWMRSPTWASTPFPSKTTVALP